MSVSRPRGQREAGPHKRQHARPLFISMTIASVAFLDNYLGNVLWLMSIWGGGEGLKSSNTQTNPDHNHVKPHSASPSSVHSPHYIELSTHYIPPKSVTTIHP